MNGATSSVAVDLPNGAVAYIEVARPMTEQDVALERIPFESISRTIEGVAESLHAAMSKAKPSKASIEFGIEVGVESGQLTALIVKGEGKANLKVCLEWEDKEG